MPEEQQAKAKTKTQTTATPTPAAAITTTATATTAGASAVRVFLLATQAKNDERHRQLVFSVFRIILFSFPCRVFCVWACFAY